MNSEFDPHKINVVLYHNNCPDGFASAYCVWLYMKENDIDNNVQYIGVNHHEDPPENLQDKYILICDFSYPYEIILNMINYSEKLLIIDHHKTAKSALEEINEDNKIFNMDWSGAYLTWKYLFPNTVMPKLIEYVDDYDTWKKQQPLIEQYATLITVIPKEFHEYDKLANDGYFINALENQGNFMMKLDQSYIERSMNDAGIKSIEINGKNYLVGLINSNILKSQLGSRLMKTYPNINFACVYNYNEATGKTHYSFRSTDKHMDVSIIAKSLGGGGHRNAAGLVIAGPPFFHDELVSSLGTIC